MPGLKKKDPVSWGLFLIIVIPIQPDHVYLLTRCRPSLSRCSCWWFLVPSNTEFQRTSFAFDPQTRWQQIQNLAMHTSLINYTLFSGLSDIKNPIEVKTISYWLVKYQWFWPLLSYPEECYLIWCLYGQHRENANIRSLIEFLGTRWPFGARTRQCRERRQLTVHRPCIPSLPIALWKRNIFHPKFNRQHIQTEKKTQSAWFCKLTSPIGKYLWMWPNFYGPIPAWLEFPWVSESFFLPSSDQCFLWLLYHHFSCGSPKMNEGTN